MVVERPQQLNFKVDDERLENLYSIPAFNKLSKSKKNNTKEKEKLEGKQLQNQIMNSSKNIPDRITKSYNELDNLVSKELDCFNLKPTFKRHIILKLSKHDDTAEYVTDSEGNINPDPNLRDIEKVHLKVDIDTYFNNEVKKY
ncbi:MAG: hypothetical protein LBR15_11165 [Methanobrevibacter sp.]|nr:hypothetical protein [Candidatus Methanovirga australis]